MSDLIPRLNYYIKNKMDVGPLELEVYRDEIERLTAERVAPDHVYKRNRELLLDVDRLRAVLHDIISGKADGCPDCARHEMVALAALKDE